MYSACIKDKIMHWVSKLDSASTAERAKREGRRKQPACKDQTG
jgi:hypothetical protein